MDLNNLDIDKFWSELSNSQEYKDDMNSMHHDFQILDRVDEYVRESCRVSPEILSRPFTC